jgi:predicted  nucleic acid-binding Zn-ribbon protein
LEINQIVINTWLTGFPVNFFFRAEINLKVDYALLKTIHRILIQKRDLNDRVQRGPRQVTVAENALARFEQELEALKQLKTKTQMAADSKQLHLRERESKIATLKGRLNTAESNREFQLLKEQIEADQAANSVLSDEILELLDKVDQITAQVATAESNVSKAKAECNRVRDTVAAELANLKSELQRVSGELANCEASLSGDVLAEYRRLVAHRGEDALAETDLKTCGNCCTTISAQTISELMLKRPVFCKSCGCLMYANDTCVSLS